MRIDFKALTMPQVVLLLGSAVLSLAAYKVFGKEAAGVIAGVLAIINASAGPKGGAGGSASGESAPSVAPAPPAAMFGALALALVACSAVPAPDPNAALLDGFHIGTCQEEGRLAKARDAGPGEAWMAYDNCMRDYGYRDGGAK